MSELSFDRILNTRKEALMQIFGARAVHDISNGGQLVYMNACCLGASQLRQAADVLEGKCDTPATLTIINQIENLLDKLKESAE